MLRIRGFTPQGLHLTVVPSQLLELVCVAGNNAVVEATGELLGELRVATYVLILGRS